MNKKSIYFKAIITKILTKIIFNKQILILSYRLQSSKKLINKMDKLMKQIMSSIPNDNQQEIDILNVRFSDIETQIDEIKSKLPSLRII